MMKRSLAFILILSLVLLIIPANCFGADAAGFVPNPETAYAKSFIDKCEGQQWLLDYTEKLLNERQMSINRLSSSSELDFITVLGFANQNITGVIPEAIGEFRQLKYLFLSGNHFSGNFPAALFAHPNLMNIDLGGNEYGGAVPAAFGTMASLEILNLEDNDFTGTIPQEILSNTKISFLDLGKNRLSGSIPAEINGMTGLEYLDLSENYFAGSIPDMSALSALKAFSAWNCNLSDVIPDTLYSLTALQILDLAGNDLKGEISPLLGNLTNLQYLALDGNALRGTLPDAFSSSLLEVHLEKNYIRGTVPNTLKAVNTAGGKVFLNDNYMTGTVLKSFENNSGNFCDKASSGQYQLSGSGDKIEISKSEAHNLYPVLNNAPTGSVYYSKSALLPEEYEVTYNASKVEITTSGGIFVKALSDIKRSDNFYITVRIKDNAGSDLSAVKLYLTTEIMLSAGGGGGAAPLPGLKHKAYISGFPDGSFGPGKYLTREQTAKLLIEALEKGGAEAKGTVFTDVDAVSWSSSYIEAAAKEGFVTRYKDGSFGVKKTITRAEMAVILTRIAEKNGLSMKKEKGAFTDIKEGDWYKEGVEKAAAYGLITGYSDGSFKPSKNITRAEAVVMINRLLSRDYKTAKNYSAWVSPFSDVSKDFWACGDILEAGVTHEH